MSEAGDGDCRPRIYHTVNISISPCTEYPSIDRKITFVGSSDRMRFPVRLFGLCFESAALTIIFAL
jgi:hypothetical protein